jgi:transcriptional antiterminator NusG
MTKDETISDERTESPVETRDPVVSSPDPQPPIDERPEMTVESEAAGDGGGEDSPEPGEPEIEEDLNEFGFTDAEMVGDEEDLEDQEDEDVDVSPIEEFVDESAMVGADGVEMDWYILKVQVNRENSICDALRRRVKVAGMEQYFGDVLVPTEDVREFNKAGKQRIVKRKLYPGYIVVNMAINDDSWFLVRETSGIGDFTGAAGKPAPLSVEEISRIIATTKPQEEEEGEDNIKTAIPFKVGDRVRVKEGYFQNHEGEVSDVDERNGRITVMINIFGRPNPVELDHWHVENV